MALRQAVSVVVFQDNEFLMVAGKDWPEGAWCFPQGGVESGESHHQAVLRELKEELGSDKCVILMKSKTEHSYLFPEEMRKKKGFDGQYQTIWFAQFMGEKQEIKPASELRKHAWFLRNEIIPNMMYPEQRETFEKVLLEFEGLRKTKII